MYLQAWAVIDMSEGHCNCGEGDNINILTERKTKGLE